MFHLKKHPKTFLGRIINKLKSSLKLEVKHIQYLEDGEKTTNVREAFTERLSVMSLEDFKKFLPAGKKIKL